jgi:tetratricopeptide (TPR) repeat protein
VSQSPETALRVQRYEDGWEAINRMIREDLSWGGYERKCFHVACDDGSFANISAASGADFDGDGRGLAVLDFDGDGRPDLALRNRTSPQIRLLRNSWPGAGQAIWVRCEGTRSNRDGIGARVTIRTARGARRKEVTAGSCFLSQSSRWLCFGLGKAPGETRGEVRWPDGAVQDLGVLEPGRRYAVREGEAPRSDAFRAPPSLAPRLPALASGPLGPGGAAGARNVAPESERSAAAATWLLDPIPAPGFSLVALNSRSGPGERQGPEAMRGKPLLLHFLSISCPACRAEADEMRRAEDLVSRAGGRVLHVVADAGAPREEAAQLAAKLGFAAPVVQADASMLLAYNLVHRHAWNRKRDLAVPTSFLLDEGGMIVKIYRGGAPAALLAADVARIPRNAEGRMALALPFPGTLHRFSFHRDLLGLGNAFFEAGLFDLARETFQAALGREHQDADSLFNYAASCADLGRTEEAEAAYRKVLQIAPGIDDARNNLGTLLARAGRRDEALAIFREVLARNPAHAEAALNLSNALLNDNRAPEAIAVCTAALALDPESAAFHRQLGYAQYRAGQVDAAIASHRKALALDPLDDDSRLGLVILLIAAGNAEEAKSISKIGLARRSNHAGLLNALGMAHAALGESADAVASLKKSIASDPRFDRPYTNLARILLDQGKTSEAAEVLRKLLEVAPGHPVAKEMLSSIRR